MLEFFDSSSIRAFFNQRFSLSNAEAVLLVRDNKAQPLKADLFFYQRMSSNDNVRFAAGDGLQNLLSLPFSLAANE